MGDGNRIEGALTIYPSINYNFSTETSEWIIVKLKWGESIWLNITGTCLKAATVIRQKKFISRKEDLIEGIRLEFGVFKAKHYEDVRIFVESNGKCKLTIQTSSSWQVYFDRIASVLDGNYCFVGALITSTFLFVLESEKRSFRVNQQHLCYILFIIGLPLFVADGRILFFAERSSLFIGFGAALSIHFLCVSADELKIRYGHRSFDSYFAETRAML